jgi:hypothetical protein
MKGGKTPFKRQNKEGNRRHNNPRNFQTFNKSTLNTT